jgi:hypothetical protein
MPLYVIRRAGQEMWLKRLSPLLWSPRDNAMPFVSESEAKRTAAKFPNCIVEKIDSCDLPK